MPLIKVDRFSNGMHLHQRDPLEIQIPFCFQSDTSHTYAGRFIPLDAADVSTAHTVLRLSCSRRRRRNLVATACNLGRPSPSSSFQASHASSRGHRSNIVSPLCLSSSARSYGTYSLSKECLYIDLQGYLPHFYLNSFDVRCALLVISGVRH